jgi:hypothetical protein
MYQPPLGSTHDEPTVFAPITNRMFELGHEAIRDLNLQIIGPNQNPTDAQYFEMADCSASGVQVEDSQAQPDESSQAQQMQPLHSEESIQVEGSQEQPDEPSHTNQGNSECEEDLEDGDHLLTKSHLCGNPHGYSNYQGLWEAIYYPRK